MNNKKNLLNNNNEKLSLLTLGVYPIDSYGMSNTNVYYISVDDFNENFAENSNVSNSWTTIYTIKQYGELIHTFMKTDYVLNTTLTIDVNVKPGYFAFIADNNNDIHTIKEYENVEIIVDTTDTLYGIGFYYDGSLDGKVIAEIWDY